MTDSRRRGQLDSQLPLDSSAQAAPVAQTIRAALETAAPPSIADAIFREAIATTGLGALPRETSRLARLWGSNDAQKRTIMDRFPGAQIVDLHDETSNDIAMVVKAGRS